MSMLGTLKAEAAALEAEARTAGNPIKHSAALDQVAKKHGYNGWRACLAAFPDNRPAKPEPNPTKMKRYQHSEWLFGLDIPARWNAFPAVPANSPYEAIRFASQEDGSHLLIVFREPHNPEVSPAAHLEKVQLVLEEGGFSNFVTGEARIGSKTVATLDFGKPLEDKTWSCRHYFLIDGSTLAYVLGFGTTRWGAMRGLFGRMAQSFTAG